MKETRLVLHFPLGKPLKKNEKALSDLEKAVELDPRFKELARKDKDFDKIRDMPRFRELMA